MNMLYLLALGLVTQVAPITLSCHNHLIVTSNKKGIPSATLIAKEIKQRIKAELQLTASAGISINKFLILLLFNACELCEFCMGDRVFL